MNLGTKLGAELGKIPEKFFNQLNGKSPNDNYRKHKSDKKKRQSYLETYVLMILEASMKSAMKEALNEIIPDK